MFLFFESQGMFEGWSAQALVGLIGAIGAVLLFLGGLIKALDDLRKLGWEPFRDKWIRPKKAWRERQEAMFAKVEKVCDDRQQDRAFIEEIYREVKPNGGESLKDKVISIESKMDHIDARVRHQDETSETAIFHLDATGRMIYSNCAFRELINAEEKQLEHHDYLSLMEDDDRRRYVRSMDEAIQYRMPLDAIVKFRLQGPHTITVRLQASPDVRHGGELKRFFGTAGVVKPDVPQ